MSAPASAAQPPAPLTATVVAPPSVICVDVGSRFVKACQLGDHRPFLVTPTASIVTAAAGLEAGGRSGPFHWTTVSFARRVVDTTSGGDEGQPSAIFRAVYTSHLSKGLTTVAGAGSDSPIPALTLVEEEELARVAEAIARRVLTAAGAGSFASVRPSVVLLSHPATNGRVHAALAAAFGQLIGASLVPSGAVGAAVVGASAASCYSGGEWTAAMRVPRVHLRSGAAYALQCLTGGTALSGVVVDIGWSSTRVSLIHRGHCVASEVTLRGGFVVSRRIAAQVARDVHRRRAGAATTAKTGSSIGDAGGREVLHPDDVTDDDVEALLASYPGCLTCRPPPAATIARVARLLHVEDAPRSESPTAAAVVDDVNGAAGPFLLADVTLSRGTAPCCCRVSARVDIAAAMEALFEPEAAPQQGDEEEPSGAGGPSSSLSSGAGSSGVDLGELIAALLERHHNCVTLCDICGVLVATGSMSCVSGGQAVPPNTLPLRLFIEAVHASGTSAFRRRHVLPCLARQQGRNTALPTMAEPRSPSVLSYAQFPSIAAVMGAAFCPVTMQQVWWRRG